MGQATVLNKADICSFCGGEKMVDYTHMGETGLYGQSRSPVSYWRKAILGKGISGHLNACWCRSCGIAYVPESINY